MLPGWQAGRSGLFADLRDVVTAIATVGDGFIEHSGPDRFTEETDLFALVVDVVLALDFEPRRIEHPSHHIADHGTAGMAEKHRAGGSGADAFPLARAAAPQHAC